MRVSEGNDGCGGESEGVREESWWTGEERSGSGLVAAKG